MTTERTEWRAEPDDSEESQRLQDPWRVVDEIGRVITCGITEKMAKLIAAAPDMRDALHELWKLIENGDLVRDISKDRDGMTFASQAMAITVTLKKAQTSLQQAGAIE